MMRVPRWGSAILVVTAVRLATAPFIPVTPEEAYHWDFGVHLDWSYFDHPGMIAWSIRAGCALFGNTALGIRFLPILFAAGTMGLLGRLARRLYGERAAGWAVLLFAASPVAFLAGGSGFPDSPLLFFWAAAMTLMLEALEEGCWGRFIAAGAALGCMGLSKYTGVFFGVAVLGHLVTSPRDRKWLRTPWPYLASAVAILLLWPVFHWNREHGWASLSFQGGRAGESRAGAGGRAFVTFLLQQWLGMLPLTIPLAVVSVSKARRSSRPEERFLVWCFLPMTLFFAGVAIFRYVHLMWPMPAYLSLIVLMAGKAAAPEGRVAGFYAGGSGWLGGIAGAAYALAILHLAVFLPGLSPVQGMYGWDQAADKARRIREDMPGGTFYLGIGRKYTCPSQLAFHLPAPFEVHSRNLLGERGSQFDYWVAPEALAGRDAVVVLEEAERSPAMMAMIRNAFASVEDAGDVSVSAGRHPLVEVKPIRFTFFRARGYRPEAGQGRN
jgi:4-amino-4-deoxy-L-arabinose transferase-like glycosyltransferase